MLVNDLVELYRKVSTTLPDDVLKKLKSIKEDGIAAENMAQILKNVDIAESKVRPMCQDTGTPTFYVKYGREYTQKQIREAVVEATKIATSKFYLRPNAIDVKTEKNTGDNIGESFPVIHFEEVEKGLVLELLLKGGGSENVGQTYKVSGKDREIGCVKKLVVDAVVKAQGKACPPYFIGVGVGGTKEMVTHIAKKQLLRKIDDSDDFEKEICKSVNELGIGPMGMGGKVTCLGVKVGTCARIPASYFVDVSINCWAVRRGSLSYE